MEREYIFYNPVDKRSRKAMTEFLTKHFRYYTMNSWNKMTSYANNVKIYNLKLPSEIVDKMFMLLEAEANDYEYVYGVDFDIRNQIDAMMDDYFFETGYTVGFNGRSGGYLVMYSTVREDGKRKVSMKSVDDDPEYDLEDMPIYELRKRTIAVEKFDKLCDDIRQLYIDILSENDIVENEVKVTTSKKELKFVPKGNGKK